MALSRGDGPLLGTADALASNVPCRIEHFLDPERGADAVSIGRGSPFVALSGPAAVRALISAASHDRDAVLDAVTDFVSLSRETYPGNDLYLGRAGGLVTAAMIAEALSDDDGRAHDLVCAAADDLTAAISAECATRPLMSEPTDVYGLAMAHGWAGILYGLLRSSAAFHREPPPWVGERMAELAAAMCRDDTLWPDFPTAQQNPTWCNGGAGFVHLLVLAHEAYGDQRFLDLATKFALDAGGSAAVGLADLCCGTAGRAYALLKLGNYLQQERWVRGAAKLAEHAVSAMSRHENISGLYTGAAGVAVLAADLENPATASMPFFEASR